MSLITLTHLQEAATYGQNYTAQVAADVVTAIEELVAEIDTLQSAIEILTSENEELDARATQLEYMLIQNDISAPIAIDDDTTLLTDEDGTAILTNWSYATTSELNDSESSTQSTVFDSDEPSSVSVNDIWISDT